MYLNSALYPENRSGFEHLGHEGRHALELWVARPDARKDTVDDRDFRFRTWHEAADLGQEHDGANLLNNEENAHITV